MISRKLYRAVLSALCVLLAALLCAGFISAYRDGIGERTLNPAAPVFTRDALGARLRPAEILFWIAMAWMTLGLTLRRAGGLKSGREVGAGSSAAAALPPERLKRAHSGMEAGRLRTIRIAAAVAAFLLISAGILNGGMRDVFYKAVKICTECIGLG